MKKHQSVTSGAGLRYITNIRLKFGRDQRFYCMKPCRDGFDSRYKKIIEFQL